jgi:hypothetical protein
MLKAYCLLHVISNHSRHMFPNGSLWDKYLVYFGQIQSRHAVSILLPLATNNYFSQPKYTRHK